MAKVKVRLLKPLNGAAVGSEAEYDHWHIDRLVALGAVELVKPKAAAKAKAAPPPPKNKMKAAPLNKAAASATLPPAGGGAPAEGNQQG